jgi:hypothetical protein
MTGDPILAEDIKAAAQRMLDGHTPLVLRYAADRLDAELDNFPMGGDENVAWAIGRLREWADEAEARRRT